MPDAPPEFDPRLLPYALAWQTVFTLIANNYIQFNAIGGAPFEGTWSIPCPTAASASEFLRWVHVGSL
jgi:hypothetical protein